MTKFEGCSSKIGPATPIRSFLHFWREIQILSTYDLDFLHKAGFLLRLTTGKNLVLISLTTFEKFKIEHFVFSIHPQIGIKIVFENYFYTYLGMN